MDEIPKLKVGQCDLDYVTFRATFVLLIFHSLQSIRLKFEPLALAVRSRYSQMSVNYI